MKQVLTSSDDAILVYVAPTKALVTQVYVDHLHHSGIVLIIRYPDCRRSICPLPQRLEGPIMLGCLYRGSAHQQPTHLPDSCYRA